jgi:hypothetical protein
MLVLFCSLFARVIINPKRPSSRRLNIPNVNEMISDLTLFGMLLNIS